MRKVSILVPVYKVEKFIEKCSRTLFEQTYESIEYIFVDDCSPDQSIYILKSVLNDYPHRQPNTKIISHKHNKGLSGARNTGLENSDGEYLLFVDSDDYLDRDVVQRLIETAEHGNADIVAYDMKYIFKSSKHVLRQEVSSSPKEYVRQLLTYRAGVTICGKLIKRSLFIDNDIRFVEGLNFGEDYVTSPRVAYYAKRIAHNDSVYYNYVQYNSNSYTISYKSKNIDDLQRCILFLQKFFTTKPDGLTYDQYLKEASQIIKVKLLVAICLNYSKVGYRLAEVANLYNTKDTYKFEMPKQYKLILWLAKHKQFLLMRYYIFIGYKIKQLIKKCFNA